MENEKMGKMEILVACEESQAVTIELRKLGHEAFSCDIIECSGWHPEWHIMDDVLPLLNGNCEFNTSDGKIHTVNGEWDMIIAFPPCTYLTVTGNRWFNIEKYGEKAIQRYKDRKFGIYLFMSIANANCERIAIENPVGIMSSEWRKPNQIINPWQFGDPFEKKTCLWLKCLPELIPIFRYLYFFFIFFLPVTIFFEAEVLTSKVDNETHFCEP